MPFAMPRAYPSSPSLFTFQIDFAAPLPGQYSFLGADPTPGASADTGSPNVNIVSGLDGLSGAKKDAAGTSTSSDALYAAAAGALDNGRVEKTLLRRWENLRRPKQNSLHTLQDISFLQRFGHVMADYIAFLVGQQDACQNPSNVVCCPKYHVSLHLIGR